MSGYYRASIYKYQLSNGGATTIDMPIGAQILCVQTQDGFLCLWALINPSAPKESRRFEVYGTGWEMTSPPGKYIGTVQEGPYVLHVFESDQLYTHAPNYGIL